MTPLITTRSLAAEGISTNELARQVAGGKIVRVRRGVYDVPRTLSPREAHLRLLRATLGEIGPDAVASHASAALLLGLPVDNELLGRVHLTRRGPSHGRSTATLAQFRTTLESPDVVTVKGVPCTTAARTLIDLGAVATFPWLVGAWDAALHGTLITADELAAALAQARRRRGLPRARAAAGFADGRAESILESISRVHMRQVGLPTPQLQVPLMLRGRVIATSDFGWPEQGVVGEADGTVKYVDGAFDQRTGAQVIRDEKRREELIREAGWDIVRWDWSIAHQPEVLGRRITAAFRRRQDRG